MLISGESFGVLYPLREGGTVSACWDCPMLPTSMVSWVFESTHPYYTPRRVKKNPPIFPS